MKSLLLGLVSALSFCLPANAAAPKLSGTYLYAWHEFCGSGQNVSNSITTGTMTFDEQAGLLVFSIEGSSFPNWEGTIQKRQYTLDGAELRYKVPPRADGSIPVSVWHRLD